MKCGQARLPGQSRFFAPARSRVFPLLPTPFGLPKLLNRQRNSSHPQETACMITITKNKQCYSFTSANAADPGRVHPAPSSSRHSLVGHRVKGQPVASSAKPLRGHLLVTIWLDWLRTKCGQAGFFYAARFFLPLRPVCYRFDQQPFNHTNH
jgi:hypothetical protein